MDGVCVCCLFSVGRRLVVICSGQYDVRTPTHLPGLGPLQLTLSIRNGMGRRW